jgi:predicted nucleotidyltransferase
MTRSRAAIFRRFQLLLARTEFTESDRAKFASHLSTVIKRLKASFELNRHRLIGSFSRGSAIRQSSDLDVLLVFRRKEAIRRDHLISSNTLLSHIAEQLQSRFWNTSIGKNGQAITIAFGDGQFPVDVVPGIFADFFGKSPLYQIPDAEGDWVPTSPELHNRFIKESDEKSRGKLKNVAKLIKYWAVCRQSPIPISSFHIEVLLAFTGIPFGAKTYGQCLFQFFQEIRSRECRAVQDPLKISGLIKAAATESQRERLLAVVQQSTVHAEKALIAELQENTPEACRQWNVVFNGGFPITL